MTPKSHKRIAIFPGTFDPFTIGHASIVERGLKLFDEIVIAVGINFNKVDNAVAEQRVNAIKRVYANNPDIKVVSYSGLTVDLAHEMGAQFLLRGVRSVKDYEYESNLADVNRNISGIETVLLYSLPELSWLSSSVLRELASHGRDITPYLPTPAE
jgi:pantetheine-phosphate adenylyltransferase